MKYKDRILKKIINKNYCILEGEYNSKQKSSISIQFVRVPYDTEKEIDLARKINLQVWIDIY